MGPSAGIYGACLGVSLVLRRDQFGVSRSRGGQRIAAARVAAKQFYAANKVELARVQRSGGRAACYAYVCPSANQGLTFRDSRQQEQKRNRRRSGTRSAQPHRRCNTLASYLALWSSFMIHLIPNAFSIGGVPVETLLSRTPSRRSRINGERSRTTASGLRREQQSQGTLKLGEASKIAANNTPRSEAIRKPR